jgi:hypothetical protein
MTHRSSLIVWAVLATASVLFGFRHVYGQTGSNKTEIVVIGTVHSPTANVSVKTLSGILDKLKPDVLLLEFDSSFFDDAFALREKFRDITLESTVATSLAGKGVKLRPYDIEGRNKFYQDTDYFKQELNLNQEISKLNADGRLSPDAKAIFEALTSFARVRDSCGADRLEVLNSAACDRAIEKKQFYAFSGIGKIIDLTPALAEFKPFWTLASDFWVKRNEAMVRNIVNSAKEFHGRRVVVMCGYEHRYYLRKRLAEEAAKEGFVVGEYWDR